MNRISRRSHQLQSKFIGTDRSAADSIAKEMMCVTLGLAASLLLVFALFGCEAPSTEPTPQPAPSTHPSKGCARADYNCYEKELTGK